MVGFGAPIALQDLLVSISFLIILAIVNLWESLPRQVSVSQKKCVHLSCSYRLLSCSPCRHLWHKTMAQVRLQEPEKPCITALPFLFHWRGNVFDHVFPWRCAGRNFLLGWEVVLQRQIISRHMRSTACLQLFSSAIPDFTMVSVRHDLS